LPAETKTRSRKNRPERDAWAQPAKVTPFAGGNEDTVSKKSPQAIFSH